LNPTDPGFGRESYRASVALWLGGDPEDVLREADDALAVLPGEPILRFARAQGLLALGDVERGRAELRSLIASRPTWETVVRSYAAKVVSGCPNPIQSTRCCSETLHDAHRTAVLARTG
jgi:hypothetical protein